MNRLKQLRNERKYSTKHVESLTGINSVSVTHYENENRDINTDNLKIFADLYNVSIDYILCYSDEGIFVFYDKNNKKYSLNEKTFQEYSSHGIIYYKDNKRYLNINKKLNINSKTNLSDLFEFLEEKNNMDSIFANEETINLLVPIKRIKSVEKFINLDDEKFEVMKRMLDLL